MIFSRLVPSFLLLLIGLHSANAQLNVNAELRTRTTADNGYMVPTLKNTNPDFWVDQRTRINIHYASEKYSTYISLQDARVWGSDDLVTKAGTWGNTQASDFHEAWVNFNLNKQTNIKIGRQEWSYDNMRLLSYRNWATPGLSYDGILLQTKQTESGFELDLGFSYNNNGNAMGVADNTYWQVDKLKSMNFLRLRKALADKTEFVLLSTLSAKTDTSNNAILGTGTHGMVISYNTDKTSTDGLFAKLEGYYQHGTDLNRGSNGNYKNISAYLVSADLGINTLNKKLNILVGAELISGHDYSNSDVDYNNTRHSFDLLYGGRFPFYGGNINHFIIQDSYLIGTKGGGYFDPYLKLRYKLNKANIIEASAYAPMLTTKVKAHTSINPLTKKPAGAETDENGNPIYWEGGLEQSFDVSYTLKISKEIIIKSGFSYAIVSDIKNQMVYGYADAANKELYELGQNYFAWAMLIIKPNFFSNK